MTSSLRSVPPETARRALRLTTMLGTVEAAAHECALTLTSIAPYTDRGTAAVRAVLVKVLRAPSPEARAQALADLRAAADAGGAP
jgi:hypothetical protein